MQEQHRTIFAKNKSVLRTIENTCGHISIGNKKYDIALASDLPSEKGPDEILPFRRGRLYSHRR
jgi:hypothetical protein